MTQFNIAISQELLKGLFIPNGKDEAFKYRPLADHHPFVMVGALYLKVRVDGRVQSRSLLIAVGLNEKGRLCFITSLLIV